MSCVCVRVPSPAVWAGRTAWVGSMAAQAQTGICAPQRWACPWLPQPRSGWGWPGGARGWLGAWRAAQEQKITEQFLSALPLKSPAITTLGRDRQSRTPEAGGCHESGPLPPVSLP